MSEPHRCIMWFRSDLRIGNNPALLAAIKSSEQVIPLFILDKQQMELHEKVYTPFHGAWCTHGWRAPAITPKSFVCVEPEKKYRAFPDFPLPDGVSIIEAGEQAALARFKFFTKMGLVSG